MANILFIGVLVICTASVYCSYDEEAIRRILSNQAREFQFASDDESDLQAPREFQFASDDESDVEAPTCDCSYRNTNIWKSGGCQVIIAAPPGKACYCRYRGAWTCSGKVVDCLDKNNYYCKNPDRSKASCNQGGGNCGGYQ